MCRLYGFRANEPTKVECTLVHAQNALLLQSRKDARGVANSDGWGIAYYENGKPEIVRRTTSAYEDVHFSAEAERVMARTVVAHVRQATIGDNELANTHPFAYGAWVFAHNGTLRGVDELRPRMLADIEARLPAQPAGSTDSELAFYWLLSRFVAAGIDISRRADDLAAVVRALRRAIVDLDRLSEAVGPHARPTRLNFLLTDGSSLLTSRWRNTLYWVARKGVHDCEVCGIPHIEHDPNEPYRAVVAASEAISHENWRELPEASILTVDGDIKVAVHAI